MICPDGGNRGKAAREEAECSGRSTEHIEFGSAVELGELGILGGLEWHGRAQLTYSCAWRQGPADRDYVSAEQARLALLIANWTRCQRTGISCSATLSGARSKAASVSQSNA